MIADIAHELRNPLAVIKADLQALVDGIYPLTKERVASIQEESLLLERLVEDLRILSLAEAGELSLNRRLTKINELIHQIATVSQPGLESKGVKLRVELPEEPIEAEVDSDRIGQVLVNLLSNAERYTPEGGEITVSLRQQEGKTLVSVADTGPGISVNDLPYVFERFWPSDRSRTRSSGGSGLGLAIAKQLVEAHGGQIGVESPPGHGAIFTLTLPTRDGRAIPCT
jgi:signal transduction histidine kinase